MPLESDNHTDKTKGAILAPDKESFTPGAICGCIQSKGWAEVHKNQLPLGAIPIHAC